MNRPIEFNGYSALLVNPGADKEDKEYIVLDDNGSIVGRIIYGWSRNGGLGWTFIFNKTPNSTHKSIKSALQDFQYRHKKTIQEG